MRAQRCRRTSCTTHAQSRTLHNAPPPRPAPPPPRHSRTQHPPRAPSPSWAPRRVARPAQAEVAHRARDAHTRVAGLRTVATRRACARPAAARVRDPHGTVGAGAVQRHGPACVPRGAATRRGPERAPAAWLREHGEALVRAACAGRAAVEDPHARGRGVVAHGTRARAVGPARARRGRRGERATGAPVPCGGADRPVSTRAGAEVPGRTLRAARAQYVGGGRAHTTSEAHARRAHQQPRWRR